MRVILTGFLIILGYIFCYGDNIALSPIEIETSKKCNLISDQVSYSFAQKMKQERNLFAVGTGGGGIGKPGILRTLSISFECYKELDVSQSRLLILETVDEFLKAINDNEDLKPYLSVAPFTFRNVEISIQFIDQKQNFVTPPSIAAVSSDEGIVKFMVYPNKHLKFLKKETYEEAIKTLEQEKLQKK